MPYALGIDLGSGRVTAAISRTDRERLPPPEVVALDGDPAGAVAVLHLTDDGAVELGARALAARPTRPGWVTRDLAARVGDDVPVVLGGRPYPAEALAAAAVGWVVDQVEATEGAPATHLVVTHPASWGAYRRGLLAAALREASLPETTLLPRPVAAAECHAAAGRVEVGAEIAVYALGARRFEAAVLRRGAFGFELRANADGPDTLGGDLFDDLLTAHVLAALPAAPADRARLRRLCAAAKERLSTDPAVTMPTGVTVRREELEELIRPAVTATVRTLCRTIRSAGDSPVAAVVLVGGSAAIPLVADLVTTGTRTTVIRAADPATAVARGAALAATRVAKPTVPTTGVPVPPAAVTDLMRLEDGIRHLPELGPPPPRPPVDIPALEPPRRRLLGRISRPRHTGGDLSADLPDVSIPHRRTSRDPDPADHDETASDPVGVRLRLPVTPRRADREAEPRDPRPSLSGSERHPRRDPDDHGSPREGRRR